MKQIEEMSAYHQMKRGHLKVGLLLIERALRQAKKKNLKACKNSLLFSKKLLEREINTDSKMLEAYLLQAQSLRNTAARRSASQAALFKKQKRFPS